MSISINSGFTCDAMLYDEINAVVSVNFPESCVVTVVAEYEGFVVPTSFSYNFIDGPFTCTALNFIVDGLFILGAMQTDTKKEDSAFQLFTRLTEVVELLYSSSAQKQMPLLSGMAMLRQLAVCCCCCGDEKEHKALFTAIDSTNKKIEAWIHKPPSTTADMTQLELTLVYRQCLQEIVYEYASRSKTQHESIFSLEPLQPLLLCLNPVGKYVSYVSANAEAVLTSTLQTTDDPKRILMKHIRGAATHFHLTLVDVKTSSVETTAVTPPPPGIVEKAGIVIVQKEEHPFPSINVHDYLPWMIQPKSVDLKSESMTNIIVMERILIHLTQMLFPKKHAWNIHFSKAVVSVSTGLVMCLLPAQYQWHRRWLLGGVSNHPIELYETFHNLFRRVTCVHHLGVLERREYLKSFIGSPLPLMSSHESEKQSIRLCVDWVDTCVRDHVMFFACDFMGLPMTALPDTHTNFYRDVGLWLKTRAADVKYKISSFIPVMQETLVSWAPPCVYQTLQSSVLKFEYDEKQNKELLRPGDRITFIAMYMIRILVCCECASGIIPTQKYQEQMIKRLTDILEMFRRERGILILMAHRREVEHRL